MEAARSALWRVSVKKVAIREEECKESQKREAVNAATEGGKSLNHLLYVRAPEIEASPPSRVSVSLDPSTHLSFCLAGSSENTREKSDFHITDC